MNDLFVLAAQNTIVALVLALLVYGLARAGRNPPVAHVLWLLVLLKLVAPPVMHVDRSALRLPESTQARGPIVVDVPRIEGQPANDQPRFVDRPTAALAPAEAAV